MSVEFVSGDRRIDGETMQERGLRAASGFAGLGIGEGDSVATLLRNDLPGLESNIGAGLLGAYAVPVNWHYTGDEAGYILRDSGAKALIVHADLLRRIESDIPAGVTVLTVPTPPEIQAAYGIGDNDAAAPAGATRWDDWRDSQVPWTAGPADSRGSMIYTSGTTGRPKGVRRTPTPIGEQQVTIARAAAGFGIRPGTRGLLNGPLYHSAPQGWARTVMGVGGSIYMMPRFEPEDLLAMIARHRITNMHVVPTMFVRLLRLPDRVKARYDLSSLDYVIHGAAPCPIEIKRAMIEWWGPVIHEYYGSTEAGLVTISSSEEWLARPGTTGRASEATTIRIYDENGNVLGPGDVGEIYMRTEGQSDFTYQNADDKRAEIGRDGFVTNGDIGLLDEAGYLYLRDRKRDMIISGGVNIYPAEIEAALIALPGVRDCAVFGIPDEEYGESIAAAIEPEAGAKLDESALRAGLRAKIAGYMVPKVFAFHAAMPREDSGKIFKRKLREPYWRDAGRQI